VFTCEMYQLNYDIQSTNKIKVVESATAIYQVNFNSGQVELINIDFMAKKHDVLVV